jgi:hypothetical protein
MKNWDGRGSMLAYAERRAVIPIKDEHEVGELYLARNGSDYHCMNFKREEGLTDYELCHIVDAAFDARVAPKLIFNTSKGQTKICLDSTLGMISTFPEDIGPKDIIKGTLAVREEGRSGDKAKKFCELFYSYLTTQQ